MPEARYGDIAQHCFSVTLEFQPGSSLDPVLGDFYEVVFVVWLIF